MPWRQEAMKGVAVCDKLRGADKQAMIRRFPNGATRRDEVTSPRKRSQRGELKHLSTRRKGNQTRLPE